MKLGLLGEVLGHSLSPVIHEKLFQKLGISSTYELIEIPKDTFQKDLPALLSSYDGLNVTIPYKVDVIPFLDGLSQEARTIGAVNTIGRKEGKLWGFNTDYTGFARTLSRIDCDVKGKVLRIDRPDGRRVLKFDGLSGRGLWYRPSVHSEHILKER